MTHMTRDAVAAVALTLMAIAVLLPFSAAILVDSSTVRGTVVDEHGDALVGARVEVAGLEGVNATTGPGGLYSLDVSPSEAGYNITFSYPDRAPVTAWTGPLAPLGQAVVNATLRPLPPSATLHVGIIPIETGQQYGNYGLRMDYIHVTNATGTPLFERTERATSFDFTVSAPGSYVVRGTRPGYYDVTVDVTVGKGESLQVTIDLNGHKKPNYGVVRGTVTFRGAPVPNATVTAVPDDGTQSYEAFTREDGNYTLQLPPGNYSVRAQAEGYARTSHAVRVVAGDVYSVDAALSEAQEPRGLMDSPLAWVMLIVTVVALAAVAVWASARQRASRAAKEAEAAAERTVECPACGAVAPEDADKCPACGGTFPWRGFRCPECGAQLALDARRCGECGNERFDLHRGA
jgi:hypothetical protein